MSRLTLILGALGAILFLALSSAYIVNQTEQALVLQFGRPVRVVQEPGLNFKVPFIQNVITFDNRLLEFNASPEEINMVDEERGIQERVVVDAFVKYRITNPLLFYQSVRNEQNLEEQLRSLTFSSVREVLGRVSLRDLLSNQRVEIMRNIRNELNRRVLQTARETAPQTTAGETVTTVKEDGKVTEVPATQAPAERGFGIKVVDVRINRADLPAEISQSTFNRMRANFAEEAQKFRSEGKERALTITSTADRKRVEILAEARRKAEVLRGEGDAEATRIYADAFTRDPQFFEFYRSMQAYEKTLGKDDTTVVLSPDSEFLKHLD